MSTQLEQYPTYKISIIQLTQESNLRDAPTLIGSGDLSVRWGSGQGRRYRTLEEISDCLVLPYRPSITDAIRTGEMMDTMVPFELGYLPTEESKPGQASSGHPIPPSGPDLTPYYSNIQRGSNPDEISLFVRHTGYHPSLTRLQGFEVPGQSDMVELRSSRKARELGCDPTGMFDKERVRRLRLVYPKGDLVILAISYDKDACRREDTFVAQRIRHTKHRIWESNVRRTGTDDEAGEEDAEEEDE